MKSHVLLEEQNAFFIVNYDGEYYGKIENQYYIMLELENRDSVMKKEAEVETTKKRTS